jgi:hypothetical protein
MNNGIVISDINSNVKTAPCFGTEWDGAHPDCQRCFPSVFDVCKLKTEKHREDKENESNVECKKQPLDIVIDTLKSKFDYSVKETKQLRAHYFKRNGRGVLVIALLKGSKKIRFQTPKTVKVLTRLESVKQVENILREMAIENK